MNILAFVVLAGLALVVLLTYSKRQRNRDRWPYNLGNPTDTPNTAGTDPTWSPATTSLMAAGAVVLGDEVQAGQAQQQSSEGTTDCTPPLSDHGATGSWGESGDTGGSVDSGGSDGGGGDGGD